METSDTLHSTEKNTDNDDSDDESVDNLDDDTSIIDGSLALLDSDDDYDLCYGDAPEEKEESPEDKRARQEKENMQLFWRLMDMGFSRERTVEAVHEKGFTELAAATEYLLSTGNADAFALENVAPKEHKYSSIGFTPSRPNEFNKAITRETNLLRSSLPEGIIVRGFEDRTDLYSVMMKGPAKTPYEDALFFFDIQLSQDYPQTAPKFHFINFAGSTPHRLNPNLYIEGKVCVSLLGTWMGEGVENWNPKTSNLFQVLISIQGLILVSEPYFNEPGYASSKGTDQGSTRSRQYNEQVITQVMRSVVGQAENPPSLFYNEVRDHFRESSQNLIRRLETWFEINIDEKLKANDIVFANKNGEKATMLKENDINGDKTSPANTGLRATGAVSPPEFPLLPVSGGFKKQIAALMEKFQIAVKTLVDEDLKTLRPKEFEEKIANRELTYDFNKAKEML